MTLINNADDFLNALDNNPAWLEAVRSRILGEEVMRLPVRFERFEKDFQDFREETRESLARHEEQLEDLRTIAARHDGYFNNLRGVDYEGQARAGAGRRLLRLLNARAYWQVDTRPGNGTSELHQLLSRSPVDDLGEEQNAADDQAYEDALRVDIVYRFELADGEAMIAAGEASVTVETQDVERARRRAAAIENITGTTTLAFVIGAAITAEAAEEAGKPGETAVRWLQMDESPESE